MTKAFISYHHDLDQDYKDHLVYLANYHGAFEDCSVNTGDISDDNTSSETIRRIIRDEYLRDSEVTILLCGKETRHRKHVDWELKSSMIDGRVNKQSGILVINVNRANNGRISASLPGEKNTVYPEHRNWFSFETKSAYQNSYPDLPERIVDNLFAPNVSISVTNWEKICDRPDVLKWLIDQTAIVGRSNQYDLSKKMRRQNYSPLARTLLGS